MADEFDAAALSRGPDKTELRGMAPTPLVQALDAIALSRGLDRNAYIVGVLEKHVRGYLDEVSVVMTTLRGNPLLADAERRPS